MSVGSLYIAFIIFRYVPCISALSKTFIMKGYCILSKAFLASNEMIMYVVFIFQFVYMVDYVDRFLYVEQYLHLWNEANLIMVDHDSDVFLDSIYQYFI